MHNGPNKSPKKAQPKAPTKAQAKVPAKAQPKAPAKAQPKAPAKAQPKARAKAQPKVLAKAQPKAQPKGHKQVPATVNPLKFIPKNCEKPTEAEVKLERLAFVLANNELNVLRPVSNDEGKKLDKELISKLYRSNDLHYKPCEITVSHADIMDFVKEVSGKKVLSPNMISALENIAYQIGTVMSTFKQNEILQLLKVFSCVEPFTIPLLSCFDMGIFDLTDEENITKLSTKEIIDLAYRTVKIGRPITGNLRVGLDKLVNKIMNEISITEIAKLNLLPRVVKILHFMETCRENFTVDSSFKRKVIENVNNMLAKTKPESSGPHKAFSDRLKKLLSVKGIKVEDEYLCEFVGTHLDIAIPQFNVAVEINGSTHYNSDLKTENPETRFKKELLEAFGWSVVPVLVEDLVCEERAELDLRIIDEIIESDILPLIEKNNVKIQSRLAAEANRNFFLCQKNPTSRFKKCRTAKEYLKTIEKVEDEEEAKRRWDDEETEMLNRKPIVTCELNDGTRLQLDLENVNREQQHTAIFAFDGLVAALGENAVTKSDAEFFTHLAHVDSSQKPLVLNQYLTFKATGARIKYPDPESDYEETSDQENSFSKDKL